MSLNPNSTLTLPQKGRVLRILSEEPRAPFHWLAMLEHELGTTISVYTRLSPQRLSQHLNLMKIEFKWLSESMDPHALSPSLERIHHAISTRIVSDSGLIWLDAVEYLIHRQGFDAFLAFTRSLADELNGSEWTCSEYKGPYYGSEKYCKKRKQIYMDKKKTKKCGMKHTWVF